MRILFLARALSFGGAERQLALLARGLAARGHAVTLAAMYPGGPLEAQLEGSGVLLRDLGKRRRWEALGVLARLRALLDATRPEVVHGYLTVPNLLAAAAGALRPGTKVVFGLRASDMDMGRYGWLPRATHALEGRLAGRAHLAITNSEAGRRVALARGFPAARLAVVPNGIDLGLFRPDAGARAAARTAWGMPEGVPVIGHVGRIDPMKDHATFLAALARLAASGSPARAVIVAAGEEAARAGLAAQAEALGLAGRVRVLPASRELVPAYNGFDLLCSSSAWGEGFSNVVAEAMACGTPAVVTATGDAPGIVGEPSRVVPPGDPAALAEALGAALALPAPPSRSAVRERIAPYSTEALAARTEALLAGLLGSRGA